MLKRSQSATVVQRVQRVPVSAGWPLVGSVPALLREPIAFLHTARRHYGDIYALRLGPFQPIILNHPDHVQHVLRDNVRNYRKGGKLWDIVRDLLGNGLAVSEGEYWLRQRRMLQPHFHRQRLAALATLITEAIDEGLQGWAAQHEESLVTDQQVHDEAITIFMAGYDTTAMGLAWTLHLLLQHSASLARLQAEIDQVLAGRTPTFADLPQLPYARMVLQEALRLYPPIAWLPRTAVADDVIDGFPISAGATVIVPIFVIQQHPAFWPDATTFRPERFAPTDGTMATDAQHPYAWLPFGAGPRLCMGREFSLMEVLVMALQRFCFTPVADRPVTPRLTMAMAPKDGVWVQATPRIAQADQ